MPYCVNCGKEIPSESSFCPNCGTPVGAGAGPQKAAPRPATAGTGNYADLFQRIVSAIIDGIITGVVVGVLAMVLSFGSFSMVGMQRWGSMSPWAWMWMPWMWVLSLIPLSYYIYFEGTSGQTIGKKVMNIRVVKADGSPCDFVSAFLRNILRFIDSLVIGLVGIIVIAVTEKRQRIGDIVAGTVVVKT
jgi:uncharacterized RDD family membrane protein YckC